MVRHAAIKNDSTHNFRPFSVTLIPVRKSEHIAKSVLI